MAARAGYEDTYSLPAEENRLPGASAVSEPRVPIRHSVPIEADGVFLGVAVEHELGVRFVATHARVRTMDQSVWPNAAYAQSSAEQLFKAGPCPSTDPVIGKTPQTRHWLRRIWNSTQRQPTEEKYYIPASKGVES
jgi:hypothetical protein